LKINYPEYFFN